MSELEDAAKKLREALKNEALNSLPPEFIAKYGNPTDRDNPVTWLPSTRQEKGLSLEDRVRYLELDNDLTQDAFGRLLRDVSTIRAEFMMDKLKARGPEGEALAGILEAFQKESNGQGAELAARMRQGMAPDTIIETIDGPIRADQIPGYRNDPDWTPSPDWADANCACPVHTELRENAKKNEDGPTGFYL